MIRTHLYSLQFDWISPGRFSMVAHMCNMFNTHLKSLNVVMADLALYVTGQFWLLLDQPWYFMAHPCSSNHGQWMHTMLYGEICSAIWWDFVRFCDILWHLVRIGKILRDMVRYSEIQWDMVRFSEIWWDMARAGEVHVWWYLVRYRNLVDVLLPPDKWSPI